MTRLGPVVLTAILAFPASAQEVDCAKAITQLDMNICAEADWKTADEVLNSTYSEVIVRMKELDAQLPENLQGAEMAVREAQRAWVIYRDATCKTAGFKMRGGSAEPLLVYGCLTELTKTRTQEIGDLLIDY
jgi:uncharacterized protein YecT (DUF1311 family)